MSLNRTGNSTGRAALSQYEPAKAGNEHSHSHRLSDAEHVCPPRAILCEIGQYILNDVSSAI